jgi:choline dehydrogenase-like flavoprotein
VTELVAVFEAVVAKNVHPWKTNYSIGQGIHEMGMARMGNDSKTSVLNGNNQAWDAKNVFVNDGACMTYAACQNQSLTYIALTARAANYAVEQLNKQNI